MTNTNQTDLSTPSQNMNTLDKRTKATLTKCAIITQTNKQSKQVSHNETT
nr:MAG TPA: hypothetical protein [Caudoviricetes sp.]